MIPISEMEKQLSPLKFIEIKFQSGKGRKWPAVDLGFIEENGENGERERQQI